MDSKHWILARVTQGPNLLPVLGSTSFFFFFLPNQELNTFFTLLLNWSFRTRSRIFSPFHSYAFKNQKKLQYHINDGGGGEGRSRNSQNNNNSPLLWINLSGHSLSFSLSHLMKICQRLDALKSCLLSNCYRPSHPACPFLHMMGQNLWGSLWRKRIVDTHISVSTGK